MLRRMARTIWPRRPTKTLSKTPRTRIQRDDQFTPAYGLQAEILRALGRTEEAQKVLDAGSMIKG